MKPLSSPPKSLDMPFSLRDLEHHITFRNAGKAGANPSRLADVSLQHWIRQGLIHSVKTPCPKHGIPRYALVGGHAKRGDS